MSGHLLNERVLAVRDDNGNEILILNILEIQSGWSVRIAINKGGTVGFHQRFIRSDENPNLAGVISLALNDLDPDDLTMEGYNSGTACSPHLARKQHRTLREILGWSG